MREPLVEIRQIKGRIFQVCLVGGFLLTEYAPDTENYYEIDKEIATFKNPEDTVDQVIYYLGHDDERRAIARAGWERARKEYSASQLVRKVFSKIEGDRLADRIKGNPAPVMLKMALKTRTIFPSDYHFQWGRALLLGHYEKNLWKDSLARSIAYSRINVSTRYYRAVGNLSPSIRPPLFQIHDMMAKIPSALIRRLRSLPCVGGLVRRLVT